MMIISHSNVSLQAVREAKSYTEKKQSLTVWQQNRDPVTQTQQSRQGNGQGLQIQFQAMSFQFSQSIQAQLSQIVSADIEPPVPMIEASDSSTELLEAEVARDDELSLLVSVVGLMVEQLTGRKLKLFDARELHQHHTNNGLPPGLENHRSYATARQDSESRPVGWGIRYESEETHVETEKVDFEAVAKVTTADGQQIEIDLKLSMSREFVSQEKIVLEAGDRLKDPLVINYAGTAASLTAQKYAFDIDVDGTEEQISFVEEGSGFLAYDKNGNGLVDDGSELFGAVSGDGFAELAGYDKDGNGWIDEADQIYQSLRVWSKDTEGNDRLIALSAQDVGAIYLGSVDTQFSLNDQNNQQLGQVRETGVFLKESGGASSIQQLDLVV